MPTHANVLAVKDLFVSDDEDKVVLVTEDLPGQALRLHINKASLALTFDQKLQVMRDVLSALDHAHRHEVIHRNLTPDAILVTKGGQARVTGFDFARVGKNRTSTIADQVVDDLEATYQAPECFKDPTQASIASDLYAAGLIFYELLTGELPFEGVDQMMEADGRFPMKPSEHKPDLPKGIDYWLQKFCEFDPEERHTSAAIARKGLDDLILPEAKNDSGPDVSGPAVVVPQLPDNLMNLPQDFILADRFRIQKKLGSGGFGVAYKVFDSLGDVVRVIKLVTKDRRSVYERLRREYKTLTNLPDHPHVVKVIWADRMADAKQTPYIVFEYVEGLDVSDLIDAEALSLDDAVRIVREAADGLAVLTQDGGRFVTREVRIEELLTFLRNRYGLHIDRLPEGAQANSSILDRRALRLNLEAFKRRLREIGFYEDLSDAYVTQKVSPRYAIERNDGTDKNGRHA
ncbi:protein kinase domain-containing protein [Ralstonia mannitolilytica]|uniref:protein kinase domain-containing protein n=1 Tax=Ralstonia mannitolilytica TaxID=105219 RepID=UPI00292D5848|nr:protein kinase [Ralstonia mannitolilytica]